MQSYRRAELDTVLEVADKVPVCEFDDVELVALLHVFDPLVSLALGVNHQRPALGVADTETKTGLGL